MLAIHLTSPHPDARAQAESLATRLGVPLVDAAPNFADAKQREIVALLLVGEDGLQLRSLDMDSPGTISADFIGGAATHRCRHGKMRDSLLARAVGVRDGKRPFVVDATAGLGRDLFALAVLGARVLGIERSPILHALLEDALARAGRDPEIAAICAERITLRHADGHTELAAIATQSTIDVVYLDPMYDAPPATRRAAPAKEMRVARLVTGPDLDAPALLATARALGIPRIVVKRPRRAPPLAPNPDHIFEGQSTRFDLYLARA